MLYFLGKLFCYLIMLKFCMVASSVTYTWTRVHPNTLRDFVMNLRKVIDVCCKRFNIGVVTYINFYNT